MDSPGHTFGGALARSRAFPFHSTPRRSFEANHEVASLGTRAARSALASGTEAGPAALASEFLRDRRRRVAGGNSGGQVEALEPTLGCAMNALAAPGNSAC